jgi:hypothetical protein
MTDLNVDKLTPPPKLVQQWLGEFFGCTVSGEPCDSVKFLAAQASRWGADQELDACCEYITGQGNWFATPEFRLAELRAARRPKPPSLKEQALEMLECIPTHDNSGRENGIDLSVIRRALEALPND